MSKFYVIGSYDDGEWDDTILVDICDTYEEADKQYGDIFARNHWSCIIYNEEEFEEIYGDQKEDLIRDYESGESNEYFAREMRWGVF